MIRFLAVSKVVEKNFNVYFCCAARSAFVRQTK